MSVDDLAPRHDVPTGGRSGFTTIDGRQVHYLEWGHRDLAPVLCLHGGGQTAYMYEELGCANAPTDGGCGKHGLGRRWRERAADGDDVEWQSMMAGLDTDAARLRCPGLDTDAARLRCPVLATVDAAGHLAAGDNPSSTVALVSSFLADIGW